MRVSRRHWHIKLTIDSEARKQLKKPQTVTKQAMQASCTEVGNTEASKPYREQGITYLVELEHVQKLKELPILLAILK